MMGDMDEKTYIRLRLWFFTELTQKQRLRLFSMMDIPKDGVQTQSGQMMAFKSLLKPTEVPA